MEEGGGISLLGDRQGMLEKLSLAKEQILEGPSLLKVICSLTCLVALVLDIFDLVPLVLKVKPIGFMINIYAGFFAFILLIVEVQQAFFVGMKQRIETWVRLLSRLWGRALCYILAGGMHIALDGFISTICGLALIGCGFLCLATSQYAAAKLNGLYSKVVKGHTDDLVYVRTTFNRFDRNHTGSLTTAELATACKEMGSELNPNELVAIFNYLDSDGDGKLSYEEFERWWTGETTLSYQFI